MSYKCVLHPNTIITHFCQTCSDLVCQTCIQKQPHSSSNHQIKQISISSNTRKNLYHTFIDKQINPLRSASQKKILHFHHLQNQLSLSKKSIQKDITTQFQSLNSHLSDKQSLILISKQTQIKHLQSYIHTFDDLTSAFQSVHQNPQGLLISYKTIDSQLKRMQSLKYQLNTNQNIILSIPRQFAITLSKISAVNQYIDRNQFINKIINNFVQSCHQKKTTIQANYVSYQRIRQLTYNATFKKVFTDQQAKFCAFCTTPFSIDNLNEQCANNRTFKLSCTSTQFNWQTIIPQNIRGTKRHFWHKSSSSFRKKPSLDQHSLIRKSLKKHYWNALLQLQSIKYIMKYYQIQQGLTFQNAVAGNDCQGTGFISKISFIYILSKVYLISRPQIDTLICILQTDKGINYTKLNEVLLNITDDYYKFSQLEEQAQKSKPAGPQSFSYWKKY